MELREDQENAINGKQKDSVRKETIVVSATMGINVESGCRNPLLLQSRKQKKLVKHLREERVSEAAVHLEVNSNDVSESILPKVKITKAIAMQIRG